MDGDMTERLRHVFASEGPAPGGHYAPATIAGGLIFVSGQLPVRPGPDHGLAQAPFADQLRQALDNLLVVLAAAKSELAHVAKVTVYVVGIQHWPECNAIFAEVFGDARPARSIVPVPDLHYGYLIELDAVAVPAA